jgi:hypothetical protein
MYSNKLVASLKANGKILREFKDTVYIPFGSEYSFLIKNLNTTRALVNIFIDGEDVIQGGLVLNANQEVDLERYVKNGNLKTGNRFKFIERTGAVEEHRGVKLEDGLIRIEFQFERAEQLTTSIPWNNQMPTYGQYQGVTDKFSLTSSGSTRASYSTNVSGAMRGVDFTKGEGTRAQAANAAQVYCAQNNISYSNGEVHDGAATMDCSFNDVGITVPGSKSTQAFSTTTMGQMETEKHTIVLKLLGMTAENQAITMPVTVKHKPKCVTCNTQNKATAQYCNKCGTALEIFA